MALPQESFNELSTTPTASMSATPTASMSTTPHSARPKNPGALVIQASRTDDVSLISQVSPDSLDQELLSMAVRLSIRRNACKVLTYALEHGAKVPPYSHFNMETEPKTEMLEILLAYGWDINARYANRPPFLWEVVRYSDLVAWCLKHGATVIPKDLQLASDAERQQDQFSCPPVLESAAKESTVATFELLRSHGAPYGPRMLHFAAKAAINMGPDNLERLALVVHMVDTLGVDPNALDQPPGWMLGNHWGTPLCYVAYSNPNWDCTEVVKFLLQRGADPRLMMYPPGRSALDLAKHYKNKRFIDLAENYKV